MFDRRQILKTEQYWDDESIDKYIQQSKDNQTYF